MDLFRLRFCGGFDEVSGSAGSSEIRFFASLRMTDYEGDDSCQLRRSHRA